MGKNKQQHSLCVMVSIVDDPNTTPRLVFSWQLGSMASFCFFASNNLEFESFAPKTGPQFYKG